MTGTVWEKWNAQGRHLSSKSSVGQKTTEVEVVGGIVLVVTLLSRNPLRVDLPDS